MHTHTVAEGTVGDIFESEVATLPHHEHEHPHLVAVVTRLRACVGWGKNGTHVPLHSPHPPTVAGPGQIYDLAPPPSTHTHTHTYSLTYVYTPTHTLYMYAVSRSRPLYGQEVGQPC